MGYDRGSFIALEWFEAEKMPTITQSAAFGIIFSRWSFESHISFAKSLLIPLSLIFPQFIGIM